jgi:hypothetical protein
MNSTRTLQLLFLSAAVAGLSACGGGGGGGDSAAAAPSPAPAPAPGPAPAPAPAPTGSGLAPATATISQSLSSAAQLAVKVADIYSKAGGGAAAVAIGGVVPVVGATTGNCPGGGSVAYSGPATGMTATYNGCVVGQHTFGGNATVSYVANGSTVQSYVIDYGSLNVSAPGGFTAALAGRTSCDSASGAMLCVADYRNVRWGADFRYDYAAAVADGSTACECGPDHLVNAQVMALGAAAGTAAVEGASGSAAITRTSASAFTVVLTAGGSTVTYPVTGVSAP